MVPRLSRRVLAGVVVTVAPAVAASVSSPDVPAPAAGVGFRVLARVDTARRVSPHTAGRPLQISLWYPAAPGGRAMRLRDSLLLPAAETTPGPPTAEAEKKVLATYRKYLAQAKVSAAGADALLATRMQARRDAPPAPGASPLVVIVEGNGEGAYDQALLGEMLAGRGHVGAPRPPPSPGP